MFVIVVGLLISLAFFDASHFLRSFKIIAFCYVLFSSVNPEEMTGRFLTSSLYLSNLGLIVALLFFSLPDNLSFTPDFLSSLRRFDEGFTGEFYWMKSFSGIFMIGDNPSPLFDGVPRYSGYYPEPGINAFYVLLGYAGLLYRGQKVSKLTNIITLSNVLLTFSVAGFLASFVLVGYFIARRFSRAQRISLLTLTPFILLVAFNRIIYQDNYFADKLLGRSAQVTTGTWSNLFSFNLSGTESIFHLLNVGEFAVLPQLLAIIIFGYIIWMCLFKFLVMGPNLKYDSGAFFFIALVFFLKSGVILLTHLVLTVIIFIPILGRHRSCVLRHEV